MENQPDVTMNQLQGTVNQLMANLPGMIQVAVATAVPPAIAAELQPLKRQIAVLMNDKRRFNNQLMAHHFPYAALFKENAGPGVVPPNLPQDLVIGAVCEFPPPGVWPETRNPNTAQLNIVAWYYNHAFIGNTVAARRQAFRVWATAG